MQLPFTVAVKAPGRPALRRTAHSPWAWLLLAGLIAAIGSALAPIPISLGPEDADGRHGDGRQGRG